MAVYFIQDAIGNVKIGRAKDVKQRLAALQTAHAEELKILRVLDGGPVEEWECQHAFRELRIRGEWFRFHDEMLSFVPVGKDKIALLREGGRSEAADSLVDFVRGAVRRSPLKQREIAELMGYKPAQLARKLAQNPSDSARFTLDDLELFISVTGDVSPIAFLAVKHFSDPEKSSLFEAQLERLKGVKGVA